MRTTLTTPRPQAAPFDTARKNASEAVARSRDGRHPGLNLQLFAGLLAALAVLGGCVAQMHLTRQSGEQQRFAAPSTIAPALEAEADSDPFAQRLQTGYLDLALAAYERGAFAIADFFARRSVEAGGARLAPLTPSTAGSGEAAEFRARFVERLASGAADRDPEASAQIQVSLDCWLREAGPDGAPEIRSTCRRRAEEVLTALEQGGSTRFAALNASVARLTPSASPALAALMERWGDVLDRSQGAAQALARPVAATLRRRAEPRDAPAPRPIESIADPVRQTRNPPSSQDRGAGEAPRKVAASMRASAPAPAAEAGRTRPSMADASAPAVLAFAFDDAGLSAAATDQLARRIADGSAFAARTLLVEGHTDASGPAAYNQRLSERRAAAVAEALRAALGDQTPPLEVRGHGETRLLVATADGVREPRNRRVEIRFR